MSTIKVDWTRCDAHGLCARLLPELISLDEWGFPLLEGEPLDPSLVHAARQAALACPALALRVEAQSS